MTLTSDYQSNNGWPSRDVIVAAGPTGSPVAADAGYLEMGRAMDLILAPGQVTELRALGVSTPEYRWTHTVSGYFNDIEALAQAAMDIAPFAMGVYFTPNPMNPALLARASNRARPVNQEPLALTAMSLPGVGCWWTSMLSGRQASLRRMPNMTLPSPRPRRFAAVGRRGWPQPILADSGNGAHLLYRVDMPVDDGGMVKRALEALAAEFDDDQSHVDTKVFNPARIWKLYGTVARKGDDLPDRPHRMARILEVPGEYIVNNHNIQERLSCQLN